MLKKVKAIKLIATIKKEVKLILVTNENRSKLVEKYIRLNIIFQVGDYINIDNENDIYVISKVDFNRFYEIKGEI